MKPQEPSAGAATALLPPADANEKRCFFCAKTSPPCPPAGRQVESSPSVQVFASRCRVLRWDKHPDAGLSVGGTRVCPHLGLQSCNSSKKKTPNPSVIAPASSHPRALLLCCSPRLCLPRRGDQVCVPPGGTGTFCTFSSKLPPISAGARSEAISYPCTVSEISLFFVLLCSPGAVLERRCQRLCFARAEHRAGTSHGRKRLQKVLPHILCGHAVLARGFSKSEALLAASHFSHLLQLHLFGGLCLGPGLEPPLCQS